MGSRNVACWVMGNGGFRSQILVARPAGPVEEIINPDLEVIDLYVHPLRRGQGWAAELMGKACAFADSKSAVLALRVSHTSYGCPHNALEYAQLKRFYNRFGFRTVRIRNPAKLEYEIPLNCLMVRK